MSDGNFNRALLPQTPYASGLKMGRAMATKKAEEAFVAWLRAYSPQLSDEAINEKLLAFKKLMNR